MISITADTSQLDALVTRLDALDGPKALTPLIPTLRSIGRDIADVMRVYPPERSGQRYERTGDLGRGWRPDDGAFVGGAFVVSISNAVEYAPWVQGEQQAWMHVGRWDTIVDAERELADPAADQVTAQIDALVQALGL